MILLMMREQVFSRSERKTFRVFSSILTVSILLFTAGCSTGGRLPEFAEPLEQQTSISGKQLLSDLAYFEDTVRSVHPDFYTSEPEGFTMALDKIRREVPDTLTAGDAWFFLNRAVSLVHDAHTQISFPSSETVLDLPVIWLDSGFTVSRSVHGLQAGDRLVAVGTFNLESDPVQTNDRVLNLFSAYVPSENRYWVQFRAPSLLVNPVFLDSMGIPAKAPLTVTVERGGRTLTVDVPFVPAGSQTPRLPKRHWVGYSIDPETNTGIFWLDSCVFNDEFRDMVQDFFSDVHAAGCGNIVIDVRMNTGGSSQVIGHIISYLNTDSYTGFHGLLRYSRQASSQRGYFRRNGIHIISKRTDSVDPAEGGGFSGKVIVLTGNATFSSGNWFAVTLKDNGFATTAGDPTGNAPNSDGDILRFQCPETRYIFSASHKHWIRPADDPGSESAESAVFPDIAVPLGPEDLIQMEQGVDSQLARLLSNPVFQ